MNEDVGYWRWISLSTIALVTDSAVYHWSMEGNSEPEKVMQRHSKLDGYGIMNYAVSPDSKWAALAGLKSVNGTAAGQVQLYSFEQQKSQVLEGHAADFLKFTFEGNSSPSILFAMAVRSEGAAKLHVIEVGTGSFRKSVDMFYPQDQGADFPIGMVNSEKYGIVYVITKAGYIHLYDTETGSLIYMNRVSQQNDTIFTTTPHTSTGGMLGINRSGKVLYIGVDENNIIPYICNTLQNLDLAMKMSSRCDLPGAEELFVTQFNRLFQGGDLKGAAQVAAASPQGVLRTQQTIQRYQNLPTQQGQTAPLLIYFGVLLEAGKLNKIESISLAPAILQQGRKNLLEDWIRDDKIECSEELGDIVKQVDTTLALSIYLRANVPNKVILCFAETGNYDKIVQYAKTVDYQPDYVYVLQYVARGDPEGAVTLATMVAKDDNGPLAPVDQLAEVFFQRNMIKQVTAFLLDVLKDTEEEGALQTRVLEANLVQAPRVAEALLGNDMWHHYDRARIAELAEKAGLFERALEHYEAMPDIKRVVVNFQQIRPEFLVKYCGTLSPENTLDVLRELLAASRGTIQVVCKIAATYHEDIGAGNLIDLFEKMNAPDGLFLFLGSIVNFSEDPDVHFKYIEAAVKVNRMGEVERICRESNVFDAEKVRDFLMGADLKEQLPLIIVCDRFGFIKELTQYLYNNQMLKFIEVYVTKVNPSKCPEVVGSLLEVDCSEDFIRSLIHSVSADVPVDDLVAQVELHNRLPLLYNWLEQRVREGATDAPTHNAIAKIYVQQNHNPEHFLKTNQYYDSLVVGKFCEKSDAYLAYVAYRRGECDYELVDVTNKNALFKYQARYLVFRQDLELWAHVLNPENEFRQQLIDQIVSTALPESDDAEEVSVTVRAFMNAELPNELIELLEKIVLENSKFSENPALQNLLILTAIKTHDEPGADKDRVMNYINRLDHFEGAEIAGIAVNAGLLEEAFTIYKKYGQNEEAIKVLLDHMTGEDRITRAYEFAVKIDQPQCWSKLGAAQLDENLVKESMESYIRAADGSNCVSVTMAAERADLYNEVIDFLLMCKQNVGEAFVDTELAYSYAKTERLAELEEFVSAQNLADKEQVGDRCFTEGLYLPAKLLFNVCQKYEKLARTLIKLDDFNGAVDAARKANKTKTWREVCEACVEADQFRLAHVCGLNIVIHPDAMMDLIRFYEFGGHFDEIIELMEAGSGLERSHPGIFTELAILYSKFRPDELMGNLKMFWQKVHPQKVIRACEAAQLWKELTFLYVNHRDHDNAAEIMMAHPIAWENVSFKEVMSKVSNLDTCYRSITFYLNHHPENINELLSTLKERVDQTKVVTLLRKAGQLPLIRKYLKSVQEVNLESVNDALNQMYIEEDDFEALRDSIDSFDRFDNLELAQQLEGHDLMEFRRISAYLFKKNERFDKSIELSKADKLYQDAIMTASESRNQKLAEGLLKFFVEIENKECFAAALYTCYDLIRPDVALELAWRANITDYAMPYMVQVMREYVVKVDTLYDLHLAAEQAKVAEEEAHQQAVVQQSGMYGNGTLAIEYNPFGGNGGMPQQMPPQGGPGGFGGPSPQGFGPQGGFNPGY
eukprot:TRINITY_DN573_c0_g1_i1.p1 TRINITY_DN573_c0_g1~~TRINITY_DN573_c0_g1_i1.p1  ORF type:complete len:1592 (-),score=619.62 TRINITY_DN573_c0_g1_i1:79-4854(-)